MHKLTLLPLIAAAFLGTACAETAEIAGSQTLISAGSNPSLAVNSKTFTGTARMENGFAQSEPARAYGAQVTFEPGARTFWHYHPLGQTLLVTYGRGYTGTRNGEVQVIRAGDIVVCPPGVAHWHGAAYDTAMSHFAIGERGPDGSAVWQEEVSEEIYLKAAELDRAQRER